MSVPAAADALPERREAELLPAAAQPVLLGRERHPARVAAVLAAEQDLQAERDIRRVYIKWYMFK